VIIDDYSIIIFIDSDGTILKSTFYSMILICDDIRIEAIVTWYIIDDMMTISSIIIDIIDEEEEGNTL